MEQRHGRELGNYTIQPPSPRPNGFAALAEFDRVENGGVSDGLIDVNDSIFASLRLWQVINHDGVSQAEELHTLQSLHIESVSLNYREVRRRDRYGNGSGARLRSRGQRAGSRGGRPTTYSSSPASKQ
ncbi:MAG TPA: hypothetical protein VF668_24455 [Pyrinomonadaceae bacterium]